MIHTIYRTSRWIYYVLNSTKIILLRKVLKSIWGEKQIWNKNATCKLIVLKIVKMKGSMVFIIKKRGGFSMCFFIVKPKWRPIKVVIQIWFSKNRPLADSFIESRCPCVCVSVCLFHRGQCVWYILRPILPPLPKVGCPKFSEIRNPWGKVLERSGLRIEHFCWEVV